MKEEITKEKIIEMVNTNEPTKLFDEEQAKKEQEQITEEMKEKKIKLRYSNNAPKQQFKTKEEFLEDKKNYLDNYLSSMKKYPMKFISTGFKALDSKLGGGLGEYLYTFGAISNIGKTTFLLQIAEQISMQKIPVLYVSLESPEKVIVAKGLNRETCVMEFERRNLVSESLKLDKFIAETKNYKMKNQTDEYLNFDNVVSVKNILYGTYTDTQKEILDKAIERYKDKYNYLVLTSENKISKLTEEIEEINKLFGRYPVVIIDYLQRLHPEESADRTIREITSYNMNRLDILKRKCETPFIVISSLNRDNYEETLNMGAFKESGEIEYYSDIMCGIEYDFITQGRLGKNKISKKKEEEINANNGMIQINFKQIKDRLGEVFTTSFLFYGAGGYFIETEDNTSNNNQTGRTFSNDTMTNM